MKSQMINESLRVLRLYWGKSQMQMASLLGTSQSYISEIEKGKKEVTIELLSKYSTALSVPLSTLLLFAEQLDGAPPPMRGQVFVAGKVLNFLKRLIPDELEAAEN